MRFYIHSAIATLIGFAIAYLSIQTSHEVIGLVVAFAMSIVGGALYNRSTHNSK
jgi:uncharacterized membrane protein